ncbi:uncharacterized protein LOC112595157 [Melanaphis sacchari]|uniref:uncharacterized protein LOC112595157 n=1 Tax=Melanaphis sacchari TaxID=742174 RepID=UPI000DC1301B|nr:uncharacterized protein LOC112595157 [Melanaphis sacchari]
MPKKNKKNHLLVSMRPQRNTKAKVVFDPSDTHIPKNSKKKNKTNLINRKSIVATTVKKNKNDRKIQDTSKLNMQTMTEVIDLVDDSSNESSMHSPTQSAVKNAAPEVSKKCYICKIILDKKELVDCPICFIKVHKECLIVNEPLWKFKLDLCYWFCDKCRKTTCSKCLKDCPTNMYSCIACNVGLHKACYDSYDIKPLQKIENEKDIFVCIACITMATQINVEEEEVLREKAMACITKYATGEDNGSKSHSDSDESDNSSSSEEELEELSDDTDDDVYNETDANTIPNILYWTSEQVIEYLGKHLPQEIIDQISKYNLNGRSVQSLGRSDITSNMGLKLGHALKLYKEVRILQTQSNYNSLCWE